ncbi:MAG: hypothetical protein WCO37_12320 [Bacteroidota bacterium]
MKTTKTILSILTFLICSVAISQTNDYTNKTKKQEYIESYIANFPYKNSEIYPVICNISLWDTSGSVPVININTIMMNMERKTEKK